MNKKLGIIIGVLLIAGVVGIGAWTIRNKTEKKDNTTEQTADVTAETDDGTQDEKDDEESSDDAVSAAEDGTGTFASASKEALTTEEAIEAYGFDTAAMAAFAAYIDENGVATIPEGVTEIPAGAFYGNTDVTQVIIPSTVVNVGERAFENATALQQISVKESNTSVTSDSDGNLYNADKSALLAAPAGLTEVLIPASVTTISDGAISGNIMTIHGHLDTAAENYAVANAILFIAVPTD